tara:strand:+ start:161 stop:376 length:216 start_codon:yes stop_codon:yes gene_type:complete
MLKKNKSASHETSIYIHVPTSFIISAQWQNAILGNVANTLSIIDGTAYMVFKGEPRGVDIYLFRPEKSLHF